MKNLIAMLFMAMALFSCSKDNEAVITEVPKDPNEKIELLFMEMHGHVYDSFKGGFVSIDFTALPHSNTKPDTAFDMYVFYQSSRPDMSDTLSEKMYPVLSKESRKVIETMPVEKNDGLKYGKIYFRVYSVNHKAYSKSFFYIFK